jgi:hypothetical protein
MPGIQETEFQQHFDTATFTDADSTQSFSAHGEMVSLVGRRGMPDLFVVAFATRRGRIGPYVLNRLVATQLRQLLQQEGF